MKKLIAAGFAVALLLTPVTAMANVIGAPGQPSAAYSNSGSVQGQAHMSSTGSQMKTTNDGLIGIW